MQPLQAGCFHLSICISNLSMYLCSLIAYYILSLNSIPLYTFSPPHSPIERHFGGILFWAIMNKTAIMIHI